jgi:hypothetical protein
MGTPNIRLIRVPKPDDFCKVDDASARPCECSEQMKAGLAHGDETLCKPCAARQLLNGIATLADQL